MLSRPLGLLFLLPALIFVAVFLIYPFFSIFQMSFTNQTLVGAAAANPQYVGLDNYTDLFNSANWMRRGEFGASLLLTAEFVIGSALIGQAGLGLLLATLFHNRKGILRRSRPGLFRMSSSPSPGSPISIRMARSTPSCRPWACAPSTGCSTTRC